MNLYQEKEKRKRKEFVTAKQWSGVFWKRTPTNGWSKGWVYHGLLEQEREGPN